MREYPLSAVKLNRKYSRAGVAYFGAARALKMFWPTGKGTSQITMVLVDEIIVQPKSKQLFATWSLVSTTLMSKKASVAPDGVSANGSSAAAGAARKNKDRKITVRPNIVNLIKRKSDLKV